jgi:hypothetical protein
MAQLTFAVTNAGLAVPVLIGLTRQAMITLIAAGQQVPAPVAARGLLDTGSDVTAVAPWILQQLALPVASTTSTHTASGPVNVKLYRVSVSITDPARSVGSPWLTCADLLVTELATLLPDADVLIGLDVLLTCKLLLDGPGRLFTLEF